MNSLVRSTFSWDTAAVSRQLRPTSHRQLRFNPGITPDGGAKDSQEQPLAGRVALVAGATRGCGRAIAIELGALGATVYGSGRSTRAGRSVMDRPETIEDTAERVTAAGGTGIAVRCDHSVPDDVEALTDRIRADHGRLDVLVNDVWGGDHLVTWGKPVWEHSLDATLAVVRNGIETHIITSHFAIPLVLGSEDGLVLEVGDGKGDAPYRTNCPTTT